MSLEIDSGIGYRLTCPIMIAWPICRPEKYLKNCRAVRPDISLVECHRSSIFSLSTPSTSNSPTTVPTGRVTYTWILSTLRANRTRLNSNFFVPSKILAACSGLIDNKAHVGLCKSEDCIELLSGNSFETPWSGLDIRDNSFIDKCVEVRSPLE